MDRGIHHSLNVSRSEVARVEGRRESEGMSIQFPETGLAERISRRFAGLLISRERTAQDCMRLTQCTSGKNRLVLSPAKKCENKQ